MPRRPHPVDTTDAKTVHGAPSWTWISALLARTPSGCRDAISDACEMSVLVNQDRQGGHPILGGAMENIAPRCTRLRKGDSRHLLLSREKLATRRSRSTDRESHSPSVCGFGPSSERSPPRKSRPWSVDKTRGLVSIGRITVSIGICSLRRLAGRGARNMGEAKRRHAQAAFRQRHLSSACERTRRRR
jgi:hypothetical protein